MFRKLLDNDEETWKWIDESINKIVERELPKRLNVFFQKLIDTFPKCDNCAMYVRLCGQGQKKRMCACSTSRRWSLSRTIMVEWNKGGINQCVKWRENSQIIKLPSVNICGH